VTPADKPPVVSNYPRGQLIDPVNDISTARRLVSAYFSCNAAVVYPMLLGIVVGLLVRYSRGAAWAILPVFIVTPILAGILIKPAIDAYADAKGLASWQRWFYLVTIPVLTPFCIGCLWTARLQSLIQRELKELGLDPKFTRKSADTMLNLMERNQRLEPLAVREEKA
jgi:hypothetical protein